MLKQTLLNWNINGGPYITEEKFTYIYKMLALLLKYMKFINNIRNTENSSLLRELATFSVCNIGTTIQNKVVLVLIAILS